MKGWYKAHLRKFKIRLYIPHGSDERTEEMLYLPLHHHPLYPTWFRWKRSYSDTIQITRNLYIPHGSDERTAVATLTLDSSDFISHMVQMKDIKNRKSVWTQKPLYPTWFRWKWVIGWSYRSWTSVFISHMVQMKDSKCVQMRSGTEHLYIPHGSDESLFLC